MNFKSARRKVHSLHFSKTLFPLKSLRNKNFLSEWGCGPCRARASADALASHSLKKISFRSDFNGKSVLEKCKECTLRRADLKFKMSAILIQKKKQKNKFVILFKLGAVSIIISKCFFVTYNRYDNKLDSHLCVKDLKNLIPVFFIFPKLAEIQFIFFKAFVSFSVLKIKYMLCKFFLD